MDTPATVAGWALLIFPLFIVIGLGLLIVARNVGSK